MKRALLVWLVRDFCGWYVFCVLLFLAFAQAASPQPTSSTISPRAFGARSWRENGLAPLSLPLTGNSLWDVRLASDGQLYYWGGAAWVAITGGSSSGSSSASEITILDAGGYYTGSTVESALQETGASLTGVSLDLSTLQSSIDTIVADPRWTDARTPLSHAHAAADTTSGTFADARISSSSITQHESSLESVLDLQDLQGAVTDAQVPDTITKTGTASKCARFDGSGILVAATGDCASGDTSGSASPGGLDTQVQLNDAGSFAGDSGLTFNKTSDDLVVGGYLIPGNGLYTNGFVRAGNSKGALSRGSAFKAVGLALAADRSFAISSGASSESGFDIELYREGANTLRLGDGSTGFAHLNLGNLTAQKVALTPLASPPVTCGSPGSEGTIYTDTSHALCYCGNGVWFNLTPVDGGSCS